MLAIKINENVIYLFYDVGGAVCISVVMSNAALASGALAKAVCCYGGLIKPSIIIRFLKRYSQINYAHISHALCRRRTSSPL